MYEVACGLEANTRGDASAAELALVPPPIVWGDANGDATRTLGDLTDAARVHGVRIFTQMGAGPGGPVWWRLRMSPADAAAHDAACRQAIEDF